MYRPQATSRLMPVTTSPWFHWRSQSRIPAMMEATSAAIHHRYARLPDMALARTVMRPLKKVENVRPGPQLGLAAECVARAEKLRDGGGRGGRVAENHGLGRAHLDTRRLPRRAAQKVHFSTTPFVRVGYAGSMVRRKGRGSLQLKLREP